MGLIRRDESRTGGVGLVAAGLRALDQPEFLQNTRCPRPSHYERQQHGVHSGNLAQGQPSRLREIKRYDVFSQTETWLLLSLVKGSPFQLLQRSRKVIPASRAIRSSSAGHT